MNTTNQQIQKNIENANKRDNAFYARREREKVEQQTGEGKAPRCARCGGKYTHVQGNVYYCYPCAEHYTTQQQTGEGKLKFDPVTRHYIGPTKRHPEGTAPRSDFGLTIAQLEALREQATNRLDRALYHNQYEKAIEAAKEVREINTWISERHAIRG